jgi:hypothetical protein
MWAAFILFLGGIAYAAIVAVGMVSYGLDRPIGDPLLALMETLTLLVAPLTIVMMAAVHSYAPSAWKTNTLVALAFVVLLTGVTTSVHFVQLTALRQLGSAGLVWPSPVYAAELLAWDVFLGLSLLFAAPVFGGDRLQSTVRRTMLVCGTMCVLGVLGPATGNMRFQFIAVVGYGLVFPAVCLFLALLFRRSLRHVAVEVQPLHFN